MADVKISPSKGAHEIVMRNHRLFSVSGWDLKRLEVWPPARKERSVAYCYIQWFFERFHVLLLTIPLAACILAARYGNAHINKGHVQPMRALVAESSTYQLPLDYTVLAPMITISAFIMGIVLSNVMSDYKESEKIPAELTGYFYTVTSWARTECAKHGADSRPMLRAVESMLLAIMATMDADVSFHDALPCFEDAWQEYCRLAGEVVGHEHELDLEHPQHAQIEILKKWARIVDISNTSIALPAYALMDLITCLLIGALVSVQYHDYPETTGYWVCALFGSIVVYLNLFVRTLDDPFEGPDNFCAWGHPTTPPSHTTHAWHA
jgi:hypothetical protein